MPEGSSVMTNTSVTLAKTGIADAINDGGGRWESVRNKMFALDFATRAQEMKAIGGQPDYALGGVHAVTRDGTLVSASASGSQPASCAWGAANVIFVAGAQKLVPPLEAAHQRIYTHSLPLEDARAQAAYGQHSQVGKLLEIHQELRGRIYIVLIRPRSGSNQSSEPDPRQPPEAAMIRKAMPNDSQLALAPLDEKVDHVRGSPVGRLIIEYGDYECPYSRQAFHSIELVEQQLGGNVRFAFRHFPLTQIHPHALGAAAAAEA
ncbi:MAG TPA: LUD domain-containing protein, partial [Streptosporangiaceae bacterium]|nr:LUD domain-containing protein [Streptosporangiaceae bacterium]